MVCSMILPLLLSTFLGLSSESGSAPDPSVSGIGLQATKDAVVRALGRPTAERPETYDKDMYDYGDMIVMEYPGLRLRLVNGFARKGPFRVLEIEASSSKWVITPGVAVGMTADQARRHLPDLSVSDDANRPGKKVLVYSFEVAGTQAGGWLFLRVDENKISLVTLTSDRD
jgi:hypothetical protein